MSQSTKKIENFKIASGIFSEMKDTLVKILKENPEIVENAIKKRNIQIKCLTADIEHQLVVFKEISDRYNVVLEDLENVISERDLLKTNYGKLNTDIANLIIENGKLKTDLNTKTSKNDQLVLSLQDVQNKLKIIEDELNTSKAHIAITNIQKRKTVRYRLAILVDRIPIHFVKSIFKFLISEAVINYFLFFVFMFLLFVSIIGWMPILTLLKHIIAIF